MRIEKQTDIKDCGIEIIKSIHNHYFKNILDNNELKNKVNFGSDGINIKNFVELGQEFGILLEPYEIDLDSLAKDYKNQYFVALIDSQGMNHYVIFKILKKRVLILDSLNGKYKMEFKAFKKIYKNIAITIEKDNYNIQKNVTSKPLKYLFKNWNILLLISLSIIFSLIFMFTFSLFTKIMIDKIIPQKLLSTLFITVISFIFLSILRVFNNFIKSYILKKLELRINYDITFLYLNKLRKADRKNINKITITDNLRRIGLIEPCSQFISSSFFVIFHEVLLFIISTSLLIFTSIELFSIALFSALFISFTTLLFKFISNKNYDDLLQENLKVFSNYIDIVNLQDKLKNKSFDKYIGNKFNNNYFKLRKRNLKIWNYQNIQNIIENFFSFIIPILLIYFGASFVFDGKMSMGTLLFFVSIYSYFISPIESLTSIIIEFPIQMKNIKLLNYILLLEDEKINKNGLKLINLDQIILKNVSFGYDREIIKITTMKINENLIIEGKNGSGKSTFLKSIKYLDSYKGEIKINNINEEFYSKENLRENIIYISSNDYFPNISIFEYITNLNKDFIKEFQINLVKYNLLEIMNKLNINFNLKMENNAHNLSSGQKQSINIFKIFIKKYNLILFDEAFENIDSQNLSLFKEAINNYQKCIKIEVSHSKKYITNGKKVNIESLN